MDQKVCLNILNIIEPVNICNTQLVEVILFNTVEWLCPNCDSNKIPKKKDNQSIVAKKLGFTTQTPNESKDKRDDKNDTTVIYIIDDSNDPK